MRYDDIKRIRRSVLDALQLLGFMALTAALCVSTFEAFAQAAW